MPRSKHWTAGDARQFAVLKAARKGWDDQAGAFYVATYPLLRADLDRRAPDLPAEPLDAAVKQTLKDFLSAQGLRDYMKRETTTLFTYLASSALGHLTGQGLQGAADPARLPDREFTINRPDHEWIADLWKARERWEQATLDFWQEFLPQVEGVLLKKWKSDPDVEGNVREAVGIAFEKFLRVGVDHFDPKRASLLTYLILMCNSAKIDLHRKETRIKDTEKAHHQEYEASSRRLGGDNSTFRQLTDRDGSIMAHPLVVDFCASLDGLDSQLLSLFLEANTLAQIAQKTGVSVATVGRRISGLRQSFREFLRQQ